MTRAPNYPRPCKRRWRWYSGVRTRGAGKGAAQTSEAKMTFASARRPRTSRAMIVASTTIISPALETARLADHPSETDASVAYRLTFKPPDSLLLVKPTVWRGPCRGHFGILNLSSNSTRILSTALSRSVTSVGLADGYVLDVGGIGKQQLEAFVAQDRPQQVAIDTPPVPLRYACTWPWSANSDSCDYSGVSNIGDIWSLEEGTYERPVVLKID
jgi:hypothetical protein